MVRPLRDEMAVQYGVERMQHLFSGTFLTMVALIPAFGRVPDLGIPSGSFRWH